MMTPEERARFDDWHTELKAQLHLLSRDAKNTGIILDAAIPFRLGWSPLRTARAFLNIDPRDLTRLKNLRDNEHHIPDGESSVPRTDETAPEA